LSAAKSRLAYPRLREFTSPEVWVPVLKVRLCTDVLTDFLQCRSLLQECLSTMETGRGESVRLQRAQTVAAFITALTAASTLLLAHHFKPAVQPPYCMTGYANISLLHRVACEPPLAGSLLLCGIASCAFAAYMVMLRFSSFRLAVAALTVIGASALVGIGWVALKGGLAAITFAVGIIALVSTNPT
jgi:hypothetical protein